MPQTPALCLESSYCVWARCGHDVDRLPEEGEVGRGARDGSDDTRPGGRADVHDADLVAPLVAQVQLVVADSPHRMRLACELRPGHLADLPVTGDLDHDNLSLRVWGRAVGGRSADGHVGMASQEFDMVRAGPDSDFGHEGF